MGGIEKRWRELDDNNGYEVVAVLMMKMSRDDGRWTGMTKRALGSILGLSILGIALVVRGPQCQVVSQ